MEPDEFLPIVTLGRGKPVVGGNRVHCVDAGNIQVRVVG